jgi:hypothetical protein
LTANPVGDHRKAQVASAGSWLEVTRLLKQDDRTKTIPIIAVTALASPEYERKGLESACDAYIPKPITLGNFLRTTESLLKLRPVTPTSFASLPSLDGLIAFYVRFRVGPGLDQGSSRPSASWPTRHRPVHCIDDRKFRSAVGLLKFDPLPARWLLFLITHIL